MVAVGSFDFSCFILLVISLQQTLFSSPIVVVEGNE
jgi:hypothetical protein